MKGTIAQSQKPSMMDIITSWDDVRAELVYHLRERMLETAGVEERVLYDGFCRDWTPAFYLMDRQLFHIHSFRAGLRATVFVGTKTLEPAILGSPEIPESIRQMLAQTSTGRGTKQVKISLNTTKDMADLAQLVELKRKHLLKM